MMRLFILATFQAYCCSNNNYSVKEIGEAVSTRNLFVAVNEGLWDNGAACGRRYRVRCISGNNRPCKGGLSTLRSLIPVEVPHAPTPSSCQMMPLLPSLASLMQKSTLNIHSN
ncbi:RlpA-like domain superfamily [Sesbania bispinosa]|nr:RlpA-like domain superfamily [Sesbania bispinosa]